MTHAPATLRRRGAITHISTETGPQIRRRGQVFAYVARENFDANGNRLPRTFSFEAVKPSIAVIQALPGQVSVDNRNAMAPHKRSAKQRADYQAVPLENLMWLTVAQASLRYPAFSEKALRHLVAQAEAYQRHPKAGLRSNGFIYCIVRPAGQRKILIQAEKFEAWLKSYATASSDV